MSAHLLCLTSGSGLPIFTRSKGSTEALPFSVIGSLNGVHMYSKSHKMTLFNTSTEDYCFVWNEFQESIVLIGIAAGCTKEVLQKVLQSCFNAMVLVVGFDEIRSQRNIERLKRELRLCYPMVDRLLDCLDCSDSNNKHTSDLIQLVECVLCPENHLIESPLLEDEVVCEAINLFLPKDVSTEKFIKMNIQLSLDLFTALNLFYTYTMQIQYSFQ